LPPPPGDEEEECVSNKEVRTMMKAMTKLFTKNQQSTDTTLKRVEHSIAGIIDGVEALETRVAAMDQDKLLDDTREDDYDEEDEMEEVEDEEPFNPLHRPNWQGMGGHPHRGPNQQHARGNDDPFVKVKFIIPPFYGLYDAGDYLVWEMTIDNKFSMHLVREQLRVRQAISEFKDFPII
jgi:hypothetical protein